MRTGLTAFSHRRAVVARTSHASHQRGTSRIPWAATMLFVVHPASSKFLAWIVPAFEWRASNGAYRQ